jgi:hypothetical protein
LGGRIGREAGLDIYNQGEGSVYLFRPRRVHGVRASCLVA